MYFPNKKLPFIKHEMFKEKEEIKMETWRPILKSNKLE
jgi:hypothetical protein